MKAIWQVVIVSTVFGLVGASARAEDAAEMDITGHYTWDGIKDGEDYAILKNGEVYQVLWRLKTGTWIGVAIRDGDRLSVAWDFPKGGNLGVAVYKIEKGDKGPVLVGKWAAYQDKLTTKDAYRWSRKTD